jgi:hypothetical protein
MLRFWNRIIRQTPLHRRSGADWTYRARLPPRVRGAQRASPPTNPYTKEHRHGHQAGQSPSPGDPREVHLSMYGHDGLWVTLPPNGDIVEIPESDG